MSLGLLSRESCRRKRCGDQNPPSNPALANCSLIFTKHVRCCLAWTHERTFCTTDGCSQSAVGEIDSSSKGSLNHTMIIPERKLGSTIYEMQKRLRDVSHNSIDFLELLGEIGKADGYLPQRGRQQSSASVDVRDLNTDGFEANCWHAVQLAVSFAVSLLAGQFQFRQIIVARSRLGFSGPWQFSFSSFIELHARI